MIDSWQMRGKKILNNHMQLVIVVWTTVEAPEDGMLLFRHYLCFIQEESVRWIVLHYTKSLTLH